MPLTISDKTVDLEFLRKVEEISGQPVSKCMQCGTCSGSCPMKELLDLTPREVILNTIFGQRERVQACKTTWLCASCHQCMARCPRGIDLTRVMEAIRQITLRVNQNYVEPFEIEKETVEECPQIALVSCFRKHTA